MNEPKSSYNIMFYQRVYMDDKHRINAPRRERKNRFFLTLLFRFSPSQRKNDFRNEPSQTKKYVRFNCFVFQVKDSNQNV